MLTYIFIDITNGLHTYLFLLDPQLIDTHHVIMFETRLLYVPANMIQYPIEDHN